MKSFRHAVLASLAGTLLASPALAQAQTAQQANQDSMLDGGLVSTLPGYRVPTLKVGDDAPKLAIAEWVKGTPISEFEDGHVYVVEFWATWCGPCIRGMPHLTKLQKEYEGDVTVIGVNIWDGDGVTRRAPGEQRVSHINAFVNNNQERMGYHVAIETGNKMSETWMLPADKTGIPSAFIVDRQGKIAWIGHPMAMDAPLEQVVAGELDVAAAAATFEANHKANAWTRYLFDLLRQGKYEQAYSLADRLIDTELASSPNQLNEFAWTVATHPNIKEKNFDVALRAAEAASNATNNEDASVLDTLARVHWELKNVEEAIKFQTLAVEHNIDEQFAETLEETLKTYQGG